MAAKRDRHREEVPSPARRREERTTRPAPRRRGWSTDAKLSAGVLGALASLCIAVVGWRFVESRYLETMPVDAASTLQPGISGGSTTRPEAIFAVPQMADGPLPAPQESIAAMPDSARPAPANSAATPVAAPRAGSSAGSSGAAIGEPVAAARLHLPPMTEPLSDAPFREERVASAGAAQTPREVVIREGDSFWLISERAYGSGAYFKALYRYHEASIAEPDRLPAGRSLAIPPVETLRELYPEDMPQDVAATNVAALRTYRTQRGDTALSVAQSQLGDPARWTDVYRLNQRAVASPDSPLPDGYELKLPTALTADRSSDLRR